jgi:hypothetical protein
MAFIDIGQILAVVAIKAKRWFPCLPFPSRLHSFRYGCCVLLILIYFEVFLNKSRKSFVAKIGWQKVRFLGGKGPQKRWRNNIRVGVRALVVMEIESHVWAGLPRGEVTERCEDQDEDPRRMDLALFCRYVLQLWEKCDHLLKNSKIEIIHHFEKFLKQVRYWR